MVDEQQDSPRKIPDDGLDDDALTPKLPFFWFGLMAIPVVMGLFASIFAARVPEGEAVAQTTQPVIEQPEAKPRPRMTNLQWGGGGEQGRGHRGRSSDRSNQPRLSKTCNFSDYVGKPYSNTIKTELELTKRPVRWFKEVAQTTPLTDIYRINVYLNPQKTITRIECG